MTLDEVTAIREDMNRIEALARGAMQVANDKAEVAKRAHHQARRAYDAAVCLENYVKDRPNGTH